jgi:hypothetical protein
MMDSRNRIRRTLIALAWRLRLVRAAAAGLRFLVVGLGLALLPLLLKDLFPDARHALWLAAALAGVSGLVGLLYGLAAPLAPTRVARLADERLGLKERLTAAEEHLHLHPAPALAEAQLAETAERLTAVRARRAFAFRTPREAPLLAPLLMAVVALALLPALPLRLPDFSADAGRQDAAADESVEKPLEQKLEAKTFPATAPPKVEEKDVQRGPLTPRSQQGDLTAVFKDTKVSEKRPDFGSFVKQGDDRMKLLAKPENIPDLSRDVTESPYQVMIRRMQQQLRAGRMQGLSWDQIERLLSELGDNQQRAGGEGMPDDLLSELQQQGEGSSDKMMSALSRALNRLRDRGQSGRGSGRGLKEAPADGRGGEGQGEGDESKGDGTTGGSKPGTEKSLQTKGDPTQRIPGDKQDAALDGEAREGRMESYDTNLSGPGAQNASRLPYLRVYTQYRRMMEEALTKEPIPFNYREQVKQYFESLEPKSGG